MMCLSVSTVEVWRGSIEKPNDENNNSNKLWSVKRDSEKQIHNCTHMHVHAYAHALLESIIGMQLGISTNLRVFGSGGRKQDNSFWRNWCSQWVDEKDMAGERIDMLKPSMEMASVACLQACGLSKSLLMNGTQYSLFNHRLTSWL